MKIMKENKYLAPPEETADLPNLPGLESVETTDYLAALILFFVGSLSLFFVGTAAWLFQRFREFIDTQGLVIVCLMLLFGLWFLLRVFSGSFYFRTDGSGLLIRSIFRRKFIPWSEIKSASTQISRTGEVFIHLQASDRTVKIHPRGFGGGHESENAITASIFQHLKKMNRVEGMLLPRTALSFWKPVPDSVPLEIDWEKPVRWQEKAGLMLGALFFTALGAYPLITFRSSVPMFIMSVIISLALLLLLQFMILPEGLRKARSIRVCDSYMEGSTLFGTFYIPWSDVTLTTWTREHLIIRCKNRKNEIWIHYELGNRLHEDLILAVIRKLRSAGNQVVSIPAVISADPDILKKPAFSGEQQTRMQQAFINSLEEPARSRIRRLWHIQITLMMFGLIFFIAVGLSDIVGYLSRMIHASIQHDTRFFLMTDTMCLGALWMVPGMVLFFLIGDWLGCRLSGPYKEEWKKLQKVGTSKVLEKIVMVFIVVLAAASIIVTPALFDCYARVTDKGFAINDFFSVKEHSYTWQQIDSVELQIKTVTTRNGIRSSEAYVINFKDDSSWSMEDDSLRCTRRGELKEAVEFVANKSGKMIIYK